MTQSLAHGGMVTDGPRWLFSGFAMFLPSGDNARGLETRASWWLIVFGAPTRGAVVVVILVAILIMFEMAQRR